MEVIPTPQLSEVELNQMLSKEPDTLITPMVSFIGAPGAGKSSLYNEIYGENVSETGGGTMAVTLEPIERERNGLKLKDYPGVCRRHNFTVNDCLGKIADDYIVVLVIDCSTRVLDVSFDLYEGLKKENKTVIVCMSKADQQASDAEEFIKGDPFKLQAFYPEGFLKKQTQHALEFDPNMHALFISTKQKWGVTALVDIIWAQLPNSIRRELAGKKTEKEIEDIAMQQQEAFSRFQTVQPKIKHGLAQAAIYACSTFAGTIVACNIPLSDVLVVTPAQVAMVASILRIYNKPATWKSVSQILATCMGGVFLRSITQNVLALFNIFVEVSTAGVATPLVVATTIAKVGIAAVGTVVIGEATVTLCTGKKYKIKDEVQQELKRNMEFTAANRDNTNELKKEIEALKDDLDNNKKTKKEFDEKLVEIRRRFESKVKKHEIVSFFKN